MLTSASLRWFTLLGCSCGLFFLSGCGPKGATIHGKVILPTGVQLKDDDSLSVILVPVEATAPAGGTGKVNIADLTFTIAGNEGKGTLPGKYKVAVTCVPYSRSGPEGAQRKKQLDAAFSAFSPEKTPLTVDLTGAETQLTVDLQNKTVSK